MDNYSVQEITWLPELVFENAQVNTLISVIQKSRKNDITVNIYNKLGFQKPPKVSRKYKQQQFIDSDYYITIFERADESKII